jgi:hypothetical protein
MKTDFGELPILAPHDTGVFRRPFLAREHQLVRRCKQGACSRPSAVAAYRFAPALRGALERSAHDAIVRRDLMPAAPAASLASETPQIVCNLVVFMKGRAGETSREAAPDFRGGCPRAFIDLCVA